MGTNVNIVGDREFPAQRTTPESYEVFQLLAQMREAGCAYAVMEVPLTPWSWTGSTALNLTRRYLLTFPEITWFPPDHGTVPGGKGQTVPYGPLGPGQPG